MNKTNVAIFEGIKPLIQYEGTPCLSIYFPVVLGGDSAYVNATRFKTLLRSAEEKLHQRGMSVKEIEEFLAPVNALQGDVKFWQDQEEALGVFVGKDFFRTEKLRVSCEDFVFVGSRFYIRPLIAMLNTNGKFYILALSGNDVRLLEASKTTIKEVDLRHVPKSLADALKYDEVEKQYQYYSPLPRDFALGHGHGGGEELSKEQHMRYFQQIDRGLHEFLKNGHIPLVLAGVEYLLSIYREVNTYPNLVGDGIPGNPDRVRVTYEELREKALPLVEPVFRQAQKNAYEQYKNFVGTGKTSNRIEEILPAAHTGRVGILFLHSQKHLWGNYDAEKNSVTIHTQHQNGDEELLNLAALFALQNSGRVFEVTEEMPDTTECAAIYRF